MMDPAEILTVVGQQATGIHTNGALLHAACIQLVAENRRLQAELDALKAEAPDDAG